jgi:hypothetical protein
MRMLAALLIALPLVAAAQSAPPPEAPPAPPVALPPPPPVAQPAPPPVAVRPSGRDTWYIGFGVGSGQGHATSDYGSGSFSEGMSDSTTAFINFKVGATMSPKLLLGFDISALRTAGTINTGSFGGFDAAIQVTNYDAMLTWFPMERGLSLRGGLGLSTLVVDTSGLGSDSVNGANLTLGAGYAFWLGKSFNLTLNLDFSAQNYNSSKAGAPSKSNYWAFWLGFDWY